MVKPNKGKMPLTESEVTAQSSKKQGSRQAVKERKRERSVSVDRLQHNRGPSLVNLATCPGQQSVRDELV